jgi:hypothetical protein
MGNPWLKKNPVMSMWLTAANKATGSARAQATGAAKRQVTANQAEVTRQILDFWTGATPSKAAARKRRG